MERKKGSIKTVYKVHKNVEIGGNRYANEKAKISPRKIVAHKVFFFLNLSKVGSCNYR